MSGEDLDYLSRVRERGCCVRNEQCSGGVEAHHAGRGRGLSQKAHDHTAIGLCLIHHDHWHGATGAFKGMGKQARREWADARVAETQKALFGDDRMPSTGSGVAQGACHYAWKGDAASVTTKRGRAQRRYVLGQCELCLKPATERHHRDEDTGNNIPSNVMLLCRRCHMKTDGRLAKIAEAGKRWSEANRKADRPCRVCSRISPPRRMWKDRCHRCHEYWRRCGVDRPWGEKNASFVGENNPRAKLNAQKAAEIRASTDSVAVLMKRYGVGKTAIYDVLRGRKWKP